MMITVQRSTLSGVGREKSPLRYSFAEEAAQEGTTYQLGNGGYFVVAPEKSLLPRFVVDLKLPDIGDLPGYPAIVNALNEHSSGFMWYDSAAVDAYDLAWRMRLPIRASSPLLLAEAHVIANGSTEDAGNSGTAEKRIGSKKLSLRKVTGSVKEEAGKGLTLARKILASAPFKDGGVSADGFTDHLENDRIVLFELDGDTVGTAVVVGLSDKCALISAGSLTEGASVDGLDLHFLKMLRDEIFREGRSQVTLSMNNQNSKAYRVAVQAGFTLARQSYVAQLGSVG